MFLSLHLVHKIRRHYGRTVNALAKRIGELLLLPLLYYKRMFLAVWIAAIIFLLLSECLPVEQTPLDTGEE